MPPRRGFERPDGDRRPDDDHAKHETRRLFFAAVHDLKPRVTGDLIDRALPLYRPFFEAAVSQLPPERRPFWRGGGDVPDWSCFKFATDRHPPEASRLRDELLAWQRRWSLSEDPRCGEEWCLEAAVETLAELSADGDHPKPRPLHYGQRMIDVPFSDDELRFDFAFSHAGWNPTLEPWGATVEDGGWPPISERMKQAGTAALVDAIAAYKARIVALALADGLVACEPPRDRGHDPLEWLARCTLDDAGYAAVAERDGVERQAVAQAVNRQAALIGLALPEHLAPSGSVRTPDGRLVRRPRS